MSAISCSTCSDAIRSGLSRFGASTASLSPVGFGTAMIARRDGFVWPNGSLGTRCGSGARIGWASFSTGGASGSDIPVTGELDVRTRKAVEAAAIVS